MLKEHILKLINLLKILLNNYLLFIRNILVYTYNQRRVKMKNYNIKSSSNTIYQKVLYWIAPDGKMLSIVKLENSMFTDEQLKKMLIEQIKDYLQN